MIRCELSHLLCPFRVVVDTAEEHAFTFQGLTYLWDLYRREVQPCRSVRDLSRDKSQRRPPTDLDREQQRSCHLPPSRGLARLVSGLGRR